MELSLVPLRCVTELYLKSNSLLNGSLLQVNWVDLFAHWKYQYKQKTKVRTEEYHYRLVVNARLAGLYDN